MKGKRTHRLALAGIAILLVSTAYSSDQNSSNSSPGEILLLDHLGRVVKVPTNEVPPGLLPPAAVGVKQQVPTPVQGTTQPREILQRSRDAATEGFRSFPGVPPPLAPYLASQDEFGNTAARPGPLFDVFPFEPIVQGGKYWLSGYGLRYSLQQTLTFVSMTDVMKGDNNLGYYTLDVKADWAIYDSPANGTAGWISSQIEAKSGLGYAGQDQDARKNLGTITDPTGIWSSVNDVLGVGFVWSQPSATSKTIYHENEYVLETFYTLQLSPTLRLQPDFQFVIDPAFNSSHDHAMVFQLQLDLAF
jgi:hypothetical protein